jgi:UDPglucose 6-dehydrogenase
MSEQAPNEEQQKAPEFFPTDPDYGKGDKPLVGVVGHGFVGKAVERSMLPEVERFLVDPNYSTTIDQLIEQEPSLVFVCTPTPVGGAGRIDASVTVDSVLRLVRGTKAAIVLKSTVTPNIIDKLCRTLMSEEAVGRFVYAPEFLTEGNADQEYANPKFMVLGGVPASCNALIEFFHFNTFMRLPKNTEDDGGIHIVHPSEASFIKYAINCFLATKVMFFNNLYEACKEEEWSGVNPTVVARTVSAEPRIGGTHWRVPGPDGKKGFGGACFPKDLSAFVNYSDKMPLLEEVLRLNNEIRSEYDRDDREKEQNIKFEDTKIELETDTGDEA